MHSWFRRSGPALALAALALVLRCYGLAAPLLDYHSWRQADTAAIARNYAANGYRLLYPQVDWGGQTPGYVESEFPLYSYTLALLYGLFGVHVWIGRLLTALAGAASSAALYWLALADDGAGTDMTAHRRAALYAGLALALMPFPIYFGRTVMPDTLMLLAAILALWSFRRWLAQPSAARYGVALLCGLLAPLAKTPNAIILAVPLAYLAIAGWVKHPRRARFVSALALYAACFALPSLAWLRHARTLPLDPRLSFGIGEKLFDLRLLYDPQFYALLARWGVEYILTPAGLPFFLFGLAQAVPGSWSLAGRRLSEAAPSVGQSFALLPHYWLLGVLLFFCAGAAGVVGQDYYILPLAGPAAWFVGIGLARAERLLERRMAWAKLADRAPRVLKSSQLVAVLALAALSALSFLRVAPLYHTTDFYETLGERLSLALPANARVGVIAPAVSEILYYAQHKGWRLDPGVVVPGGLASLPPDLGVRYLLVADPTLTEHRDVLTAALREYRRIPVGPYALLLDLASPGSSQPGALVWETGHLIEEPFLSYWRQAGVEQLGYPLSDALDGPEGRVQYFERAVLLQQGDRAERLPVGRLLLEAQSRSPQPAAVAQPFRAAWEQAGGAHTLGMPLSDLLSENGDQVQFFEFGLLQAPPGSMPAVGAAGRRLLEARGLTEERQIELLRDQQ